MQDKYKTVGTLLGLTMFCSISGWSNAQTDNISSEHVYRIIVDCGGEPTFGTGFLSSEHKGIVTALHVVDAGCSISAASESGKRFDSMCIQQSSTADDIAVLWSTELATHIAGSLDDGYETHPGVSGSIEGPSVSFGYARSTSIVLRRDTLSMKPRNLLRDVVFAPDLDKWKSCKSPSLDANVYRIEGIASPGDSGGPVFMRGDRRVIGVISGGRAYDNVFWATSLSDTLLTRHVCPIGELTKLRNDACKDLRYFYTEEEETSSRLIFGMPIDDSLSNSKSPPWYQSRWIWALGATVGGVLIIQGLDDDPQQPSGNNLTIAIPLP